MNEPVMRAGPSGGISPGRRPATSDTYIVKRGSVDEGFVGSNRSEEEVSPPRRTDEYSRMAPPRHVVHGEDEPVRRIATYIEDEPVRQEKVRRKVTYSEPRRSAEEPRRAPPPVPRLDFRDDESLSTPRDDDSVMVSPPRKPVTKRVTRERTVRKTVTTRYSSDEDAKPRRSSEESRPGRRSSEEAMQEYEDRQSERNDVENDIKPVLDFLNKLENQEKLEKIIFPDYDPSLHMHHERHKDFSDSVNSNALCGGIDKYSLSIMEGRPKTGGGGRYVRALASDLFGKSRMTDQEFTDYVTGKDSFGNKLIKWGLQQQVIAEWADSIGNGTAEEVASTNEKFRLRLKKLGRLLKGLSANQPYYIYIVYLQNLHLRYMAALGTQLEQLRKQDEELSKIQEARDELWSYLSGMFKCEECMQFSKLIGESLRLRARYQVMTFLEIFTAYENMEHIEVVVKEYFKVFSDALRNEQKEHRRYKVFFIAVECVCTLGGDKTYQVFSVNPQGMVSEINSMRNINYDSNPEVNRKAYLDLANMIDGLTPVSVPFDSLSIVSAMEREMDRLERSIFSTEEMTAMMRKCFARVYRGIGGQKTVERVGREIARIEQYYATRAENRHRRRQTKRLVAESLLRNSLMDNMSRLTKVMAGMDNLSSEVVERKRELDAEIRKPETNVRRLSTALSDLEVGVLEDLSNRSNSVSDSGRRVAELEEENQKLKRDVERTRAAMSKQLSQVGALKEDITYVKSKEVSEMEAVNRAREERIAVMEGEVRKANDEIERLNNAMEKMRAKKDACEEELAKSKDAQRSMREKHKDEEASGSQLMSIIKNLREKLNACEKGDTPEAREATAMLKRDLEAQQAEVAKLNRKLAAKEREIAAMQAAEEKLRAAQVSLKEETVQQLKRGGEKAKQSLEEMRNLMRRPWKELLAMYKRCSDLKSKLGDDIHNRNIDDDMLREYPEKESWMEAHKRDKEPCTDESDPEDCRKRITEYRTYFSNFYLSMLGFARIFVMFRPKDDRIHKPDPFITIERANNDIVIPMLKGDSKKNIEIFDGSENFLEGMSNEEIFEGRLKPVLESRSNNAIIMAYGQSGSGKTRLLLGETAGLEGSRGEVNGLLGLTLKYLYRLGDVKNIRFRAFQYYIKPSTSFKMPEGQIYEMPPKCFKNEHSNDKMYPLDATLETKEREQAEVQAVYRDCMVEVKNKWAEDPYDIKEVFGGEDVMVRNILLGLYKNRVKRRTVLNQDGSSRSHVFFLIVYTDTASDTDRNILFCDLGGSEISRVSMGIPEDTMTVAGFENHLVFGEGQLINNTLNNVIMRRLSERFKNLKRNEIQHDRHMDLFLSYFMTRDAKITLFLMGQQYKKKDSAGPPDEVSAFNKAIVQTSKDLFRRLKTFYGVRSVVETQESNKRGDQNLAQSYPRTTKRHRTTTHHAQSYPRTTTHAQSYPRTTTKNVQSRTSREERPPRPDIAARRLRSRSQSRSS